MSKHPRPLILISLSDKKHFPVEKDFVLVGRQEICDLRIDHKSVSKQHCILFKRGEKLYLRDLGSTNGSHVNGKRVRRAVLKGQDVLGVAGFSYRLTYAGAGKPDRKTQENAGTKKLTPEEVEALNQAEEASSTPESLTTGPVVQVNSLPDEYTPVVDPDD